MRNKNSALPTFTKSYSAAKCFYCIYCNYIRIFGALTSFYFELCNIISRKMSDILELFIIKYLFYTFLLNLIYLKLSSWYLKKNLSNARFIFMEDHMARTFITLSYWTMILGKDSIKEWDQTQTTIFFIGIHPRLW